MSRELCYGRYGQPNTSYCTNCHVSQACIAESRKSKMFKTQEEMEKIMVSDHAKAMQQATGRAYGHYWKNVKDLDGIDVYKVLELFEVRSHAVGHAIKKLLVAGARGAKDEKQDVSEAIAALKRHLEMLEGK